MDHFKMTFILKVFVESIAILFVFCDVVFSALRHVGSQLPTEDGIRTPCIRRQSPNHWMGDEPLN